MIFTILKVISAVKKVSGHIEYESGRSGIVSGQGRVPEEVLHHQMLEWGIATLINSLGTFQAWGIAHTKVLWQKRKYSAFTKSHSL